MGNINKVNAHLLPMFYGTRVFRAIREKYDNSAAMRGEGKREQINFFELEKELRMDYLTFYWKIESLIKIFGRVN